MQIHSPAQLSYDWHGSPIHPFQDTQPAYEAAICCLYVMPGIPIFPFELPPLTAGARDRVGFETVVTSVVGIGGKDAGAGDSEGDGEAAGITSALVC